MFLIQLRGRMLRKNLHVSFGHGIVPTKCKSCFASGASLHTSRDRHIRLTLTPLSFCIHPSYSKYLCALQPCQRFHPHLIHFTQDFFLFFKGGGKDSKQNRVCKLGGGRSIILAVLASKQREMLFIHAQHIIQPKWQALLRRNPGLSWLPESITAYSQGGGGRGARRSRGGCQQGMGKFTLCQPAWHSTSFVDKCKSASSFSQALKCTVSPPPSLSPFPKLEKKSRPS